MKTNRVVQTALSRVILPLVMMAALLIPASAADYPSYSDARAPLGGYTATLEQMAAKRLYAYGILDATESQESPATDERGEETGQEEKTAELPLNTDGTPDRLDMALLLYRICGEQAESPCRFSDVPEDYADAVSWLTEAGATKGIGYGLYGTGPATEDQFITFIGRLMHWQTEELSILETITAKYGIENLQPVDGRFTFGELYQLACGLIDYAYPECCVPVNGKEATPETIVLYVHSYADAMRQIRKVATYLPLCIDICYCEDCPSEDIRLIQKNLDWNGNTKTMPMLEMTNPERNRPFSIWKLDDRHDRIAVNSYSQAAEATASVSNWLTVFNDDAFSNSVLDFYRVNVSSMKQLSAYERVLQSHELICRLAEYDNSEYNAKSNCAMGVRLKAHELVGFFENGKIVCDGYANLYSWMLMQLGVDNYIVYGQAGGGGHAWNKVCLLGGWYNVDVCWDDRVVLKYRYFLKSDEHMEENRHQFTDGFSMVDYSSEDDFVIRRIEGKPTQSGERNTLRFDLATEQ